MIRKKVGKKLKATFHHSPVTVLQIFLTTLSILNSNIDKSLIIADDQ